VQGSGARIQADFGLPNLVQFPITEALSAAGDTGTPLVVSEPAGAVAQCFSQLGAAVVQEIAKLRAQRKNSVRFDRELDAFVVRLPAALGAHARGGESASGDEDFLLDPAVVRRNDTSARSVNEWTGERMLRDKDFADDVRPAEVAPHVTGRLQPGSAVRAARGPAAARRRGRARRGARAAAARRRHAGPRVRGRVSVCAGLPRRGGGVRAARERRASGACSTSTRQASSSRTREHVHQCAVRRKRGGCAVHARR
jgi:hypothetical protein